MKKFTAIICTMAMLAALAGCDNGESSPESGSVSAPESTLESSGESSGSSSESVPESTSSESSESLPEESVPTKGEPTFLTCVDGTVVYTSDITKLEGAVYDVDGQLEQFSLGDLDEERFLNCDYMVVCGGFAYAFTPKYSFNPAQNPDMFETVEGIGLDNYWSYVGEEVAPSGEFYRVGVGDKFGALTVKSAETEFYSNYMNYDMSINGAYTWSGTLEFDGELELTGYISVSNPNEGYDEGGEMRLVLDNECAGLIPLMKYEVVEDAVLHYTHGNWDGNGYGDYNMFSLGNIHDYDIELDGLEIGEHNVHVRITVGDIVSRGSSGFSEVDARVLSLERI
ncbi:MAG: hypothetical protein NC299_00095 [Lachnospiraceae bacterium]|nr:hypothetical protein [Ruminococcus sp.]MCM1273746.1 hypothetical protein [Lachnospiraceae bacterium]